MQSWRTKQVNMALFQLTTMTTKRSWRNMIIKVWFVMMQIRYEIMVDTGVPPNLSYLTIVNLKGLVGDPKVQCHRELCSAAGR